MASSEDDLLLPDELSQLWACEDAIQEGMQAWLAVCEALHTIRTGRLYREDYPTFAEYCREKWNLTDKHARNLANAWDVALTIDPDPLGNAEQLPANERQARELVQVPRERRAEVWEAAVGAAGGVEHVCAHDVRTAREAAMEAESEVAPWHAAPSTHATGAAGQVFEHEPVTPERGPSFDLVIMDEAIEAPPELLPDPAAHAERLIRKYGGYYVGQLIHELDRILTEKGL